MHHLERLFLILLGMLFIGSVIFVVYLAIKYGNNNITDTPNWVRWIMEK